MLGLGILGYWKSKSLLEAVLGFLVDSSSYSTTLL